MEVLRKQQLRLSGEIKREVLKARREGVTWVDLAKALGVTPQAVSKLYGPYPVKKTRKAAGRLIDASPPGPSHLAPTGSTVHKGL